MLNPNEAPNGYVAVEEIDECLGCFFVGDKRCASLDCGGNSREDGCYVIFKKIKK